MARTAYFESIDDVLGEYGKRFFGAGFRRVEQTLTRAVIDGQEGIGEVRGRASIRYPRDWSKKDKARQLGPHLSSIDALMWNSHWWKMVIDQCQSIFGNSRISY